mgnify:CR=1 FL=1
MRRTVYHQKGESKSDRMLTEHEEQREFVSWFRKNYDPVRIFAIPNGGHRSKTQGMKLKAEGVSAGVPDLYVPEWRLWIEMKRITGGTVAPKQREWIKYLTDIVGDSVAVCAGAGVAMEYITEFANKFENNVDNLYR